MTPCLDTETARCPLAAEMHLGLIRWLWKTVKNNEEHTVTGLSPGQKVSYTVAIPNLFYPCEAHLSTKNSLAHLTHPSHCAWRLLKSFAGPGHSFVCKRSPGAAATKPIYIRVHLTPPKPLGLAFQKPKTSPQQRSTRKPILANQKSPRSQTKALQTSMVGGPGQRSPQPIEDVPNTQPSRLLALWVFVLQRVWWGTVMMSLRRYLWWVWYGSYDGFHGFNMVWLYVNPNTVVKATGPAIWVFVSTQVCRQVRKYSSKWGIVGCWGFVFVRLWWWWMVPVQRFLPWRK